MNINEDIDIEELYATYQTHFLGNDPVDDIDQEFPERIEEEQYGIDFGEQESDEEKEREYSYDEEEELGGTGLHYEATFADLQRVATGTKATGLSGEKYLLTEKDIIKNKFYRATISQYFHDIDEDNLNNFRGHLTRNIEPLPDVSHLNILLLTLAAYFLWIKKEINKENIKEYLKDKPSVYPTDFVRYIRFLGNIKV